MEVTEMLEGVIIGIIIGVVMLIINAFIHRTGIQTRTDRLEKDIEELKEGQIAILEVLLPLILALKGNKPNGEVERALQRLNDYIIHK